MKYRIQKVKVKENSAGLKSVAGGNKYGKKVIKNVFALNEVSVFVY